MRRERPMRRGQLLLRHVAAGANARKGRGLLRLRPSTSFGRPTNLLTSALRSSRIRSSDRRGEAGPSQRYRRSAASFGTTGSRRESILSQYSDCGREVEVGARLAWFPVT